MKPRGTLSWISLLVIVVLLALAIANAEWGLLVSEIAVVAVGFAAFALTQRRRH